MLDILQRFVVWHLRCVFVSDRIRLRKWKCVRRPALLLPSIDLRPRGKDDVLDHHAEETISVLWLSVSCNIYEVDWICGFVFPLCNVPRENMHLARYKARRLYIFMAINFLLWNKVLSLIFCSSLVLSVDGTSTSHLISSNLQPDTKWAIFLPLGVGITFESILVSSQFSQLLNYILNFWIIYFKNAPNPPKLSLK